MALRLLLTIVALSLFTFTLRHKDKLSSSIMGGLTLGLLLTSLGMEELYGAGSAIHIIATLLIIVQAMKNKQSSIFWKLMLTFSGLASTYWTLTISEGWAYYSMFSIGLIIPLIIYTVLLARGLYKRSEFGFMTLINLEFLIQILA